MSSEILALTSFANSAFLNACNPFVLKIFSKFFTSGTPSTKSDSQIELKFSRCLFIVFIISDFGSKSSNSPHDTK